MDPPAAAAQRPRPGLAQHLGGPDHRQLQRRQQARQQAAPHRRQQEEQHHARVHLDAVGARQGTRRERAKRMRARPREQQADAAGEERQCQTLGQHLPRQPRRPGAERRPQRELVAPLDRARQHQVGDVGARNQDHERDRPEEEPQRPLGRRADDAIDQPSRW